jgi:ribosomal protein S12 methylthiotransferase accessory factor
MLASVRPLLGRAGITRLANVTGLDRTGIPVVVGVRPNARILSQSAGKGLTLELAMVSAAMEGIELFHAEVVQPPELYQPYADLATRHAVIPLHQLPLTRHAIFSPLVPERWTFGWDLIQSRTVWVPLDLVVLPVRSERGSALFSFQATSNGLASGAAFVEALTAGLLEVIERDAIACRRVAAESFGRPMPRVRLETATHFPLVQELLERIERADVRALVYDCTVDTHVPVYWAILYEATERRVGLAEGGGAHLDPEIALLRALTEAAQARVVAIGGARDDRFGRDLGRGQLTDSRQRILDLEAQPPSVDLRERRSPAATSFEADLEHLLARLASAGLEQTVVVDLTLPEFRDVLSVVRVIVPGLDGPGFEQGHPSPRATAFARQAAA